MQRPDSLLPFIESAIQDGLFSPTLAWRKNHLRPEKLSEEHLEPVQIGTVHSTVCASSSGVNGGAKRKEPICNPIDTCAQLKAEGYRCLFILSPLSDPPAVSPFLKFISRASDQASNQTSSRRNPSWDQLLISSLWYGLHPVGSALTPTILSARLLRKWFQSTAELSPQRRLERFTNELLLVELRSGPLAICLNNLTYFQTVSDGVERLFSWINHCYQQLTTQKGCHPLRFVVLGQIVLWSE